jgi:hypothetical protein
MLFQYRHKLFFIHWLKHVFGSATPNGWKRKSTSGWPRLRLMVKVFRRVNQAGSTQGMMGEAERAVSNMAKEGANRMASRY